jgi:hypothetical protein
MLAVTSRSESPAAIRVDLGAIFVSMELSRSKGLMRNNRSNRCRVLARTGMAYGWRANHPRGRVRVSSRGRPAA